MKASIIVKSMMMMMTAMALIGVTVASAYDIPISELDRYHFALPDSTADFVLAPKYFVDEVDPAAKPAKVNGAIEAFAARDEWQSVGFVIYATADLKDLSIEAPDFKGPSGAALSADQMIIRLNRRVHQRIEPRVSWDNVVNRAALLDPARPFDLPAGHFKEVTVTFRVPTDQAPGFYEGDIRVRCDGRPPQALPIKVQVLNLRLRPSRKKQYGMYYYKLSLEPKDRPRILASLKDMRDHYVNHLFGYFSIQYIEKDGDYFPAYDELETGLGLMREAGFTGSAIVKSGLTRLDRKLVEGDLLTAPSADWPPDKIETLHRAAKRAMDGLELIKKKYPDIEIIVTHMDEVFGRKRFDRYVRLTEALRKANPDQRVYITLHNIPTPHTEKRLKQIDPYVDIRSYNGHGLELWIQGGHRFEELTAEMKRTGDTAWMYHNPNRPYYLARWSQIINGLFMWWTPIEVHIPFRYRTIRGEPFQFIHNMGYTVVSPDDGVTPIAMRHWEAFRLGAQDAFYFEALEELTARAEGASAKGAEEARAWLDHLQSLCPTAEEIKDMENNRSPLLEKAATELGGKELELIRRQTADHIIALREALNIRD